MRVTALFLLALGLALTGCPDTPAPPATPAPVGQPAAPATPAAPAAAASPAAPATPDTPAAAMAKEIMDSLGFSVCTQYKDDACADPADTFPADVPVIHAVLVTTKVPRKAGTYAIKWICEDSGGAAPPNYVIDTSTGDLAKILRKLSTHVTIHGQISKPTKGWPKGKYRVEVHLDGELADTARFKIE